MKGGINKMMRNVVASTADSEYEKVSPKEFNCEFRG